MAGAPRLFSVTYAGFTVDGSGSYHPTDKFKLSESPESMTFEFDFIVKAASGAALKSATDTAMAAWRTPRSDLSVTFNGGGAMTWKQSDNTGFDADPDIRKIGDEWDGGKTRLLHASVTMGRPANYLGLNGRRTSVITTDFDESRRRTVTITGEYTALGGNAATVQYDGQVDAFTANVLTLLGGSFELMGESTEYVETDKVLKFTRRYHELLFKQLANPDAIVEQSFRMNVRREGPGDTSSGLSAAQAALNAALGGGGRYPNVRRLATIDVDYSASVDSTVTKDLVGLSVALLATVAAEVRRVVAAVGLALVESTPGYDFDANKLTLRQTYQAALQNGWVEYARSVKTNVETGATTVPVWDGVPFSRYVYQGPKVAIATVTEKGLYVGAYTSDPLGRNGPTPGIRVEGVKKWVLLKVDDDSTPMLRGLDGIQLSVFEVNRSLTYEGVAAVAPKTVTTVVKVNGVVQA